MKWLLAAFTAVVLSGCGNENTNIIPAPNQTCTFIEHALDKNTGERRKTIECKAN